MDNGNLWFFTPAFRKIGRAGKFVSFITINHSCQPKVINSCLILSMHIILKVALDPQERKKKP